MGSPVRGQCPGHGVNGTLGARAGHSPERTAQASERLETVHRMVRERIVFREEDREMAVDLERGIALLDELDPVLDSLD